mmetsp:Transcript_18152/g.22556  ORF Transcript_18152/g.22556 Transcript_18152/m.22556 type:complete len:489 (-) Transcript_18152:65-1531(-)
MLKQMKPFVEHGVQPQMIARTVCRTGALTVERVRQLSVSFDVFMDSGRDMLLKTASTALNSKLIASQQDFFAPMIVDAVSSLHEGGVLDEANSLIAVKKIPGGDVKQSFLVNGVAFKKTFSYAGFEQMPKKFSNPKILLLNVELELKSEKENAEVRITDPDQYQSIVDAEWQVIYDKLDACVNCGANIVLSKLPIGDLATQYFADRGMFCAGRVEDADLKRVAKATRGCVQTSTSDFERKGVLGTCGSFEERRVGDERFNVFTECPAKLTFTFVLRGGSEQFIAESERSIHDSLMVVKQSLNSKAVVAGGGAVEMEVAKYLKDHALTIEGKEQLIVTAYAKALEIIPRQLSENAGFDSTDILSALRKKHSEEKSDEKPCWYGVDIINGGICDTFELGVWEPSENKCNSFAAATESTCVILSIDETVRNPKSQAPGAATGMMDANMGGGQKPLSNMMGNAMDGINAGKGGSRSGNLGNGVSWMKGRGGG